MAPGELNVNDGVVLTQNALNAHIGSWGSIFLAVCIFLFAYSSILGNYAYAEGNMRFLHKSKLLMTIFRIFVVIVVYLGAQAKVSLVWDSADLIMAIMAIINLIAILCLAKYVLLIYKDYIKQLKQGNKKPVFKQSDYPELAEKLEKDVW